MWPYGTCKQLLKQQQESREFSLSSKKETNLDSNLKSGIYQLFLSSFVLTPLWRLNEYLTLRGLS